MWDAYIYPVETIARYGNYFVDFVVLIDALPPWQAFKVYCIRLYQTRERLKQAATAVLQVWDGLAWMPSKEWGQLSGSGPGLDHDVVSVRF